MTRTSPVVLLALIFTPLLAGAGEPDAAPPTADARDTGVAEIQALLDGGKPAAAVELCKANGVNGETSDRPVRVTCAAAYTKVADRMHLIGLKSKARAYWLLASKLNLALLDDLDFMARLRVEEPAPPPQEVAPVPQSSAAPSPAIVPMPLARPSANPKPAAKKAAEPPGPRGHRKFYLGLGGGYDGLGSLHIGWVHGERVLLETSVGWIFPVVDTRVRLLGFKRPLTPYVGIGVTTPLADDDTLDLELEAYERLYALGQTVHVDLGLTWAFHERLEALAGAAFVSSLDSNDPNQVIFFPQLAAQLSFKL